MKKNFIINEWLRVERRFPPRLFLRFILRLFIFAFVRFGRVKQ